ncbi:hypothetical protein Gocc_0889 [Gaiella occulta]|uniref:Uncharacterized protein n=1 Tax=Gaiella occulta TaxID=1002870 RepID=A0A7M2YZZ1_9ACTN|nr:hypothetical protein [Gaiella occulta]RDI75091.1 hypothetical protein Gocc_0889 [Gaiella occulta]
MDRAGLIGTAAHPDVEVSRMCGAPCVKRDTGKPGMGRTTREWVLVPAAHAERWPEPAEWSLAG